MKDRDDDCCREAWIAGNKCADRIIKETIRQEFYAMPVYDFLAWLSGFIAEETDGGVDD